MTENQGNLSPLEQMNRLLSEKEAVIDVKLEELKQYRQELTEFESQLAQKAAEVKRAQKELAAEKESIKNRWDELREYEKNLEASMSEVLAEKVLIEQRSMSDLEKMLKRDELLQETAASSEFDLNALKQSVGIDVPNFGTSPETEKEELAENEDIEEENTIPSIYALIQSEVTRKFKSPKPYVLEETKLCLCMQLGSRELRVFDNGIDETDTRPVMHLIIGHKNAKNDSKLQRKIVSLARILPDWDFETKENQLTCIYYYEKQQDAKTLISKLKECIEKVEE